MKKNYKILNGEENCSFPPKTMAYGTKLAGSEQKEVLLHNVQLSYETPYRSQVQWVQTQLHIFMEEKSTEDY